MCFQAIQHAIFQFFESSEGKGVNDENDLVIYLGYKNYFDLISLTATLLVSGKRKVFEIEFHLKGSLDPKEIEVCKKEVCKMKVHPMKGMTYETAPSHIKKAWNKMKETGAKLLDDEIKDEYDLAIINNNACLLRAPKSAKKIFVSNSCAICEPFALKK